MSTELPPGWKEKQTADGRVYYEDSNTKTTHWKLPESDTKQMQQTQVIDTPVVVLPPGWKEKHTADGRVYYEDSNTKTTHWKLPEADQAPVVQVMAPTTTAKPEVNVPLAPSSANRTDLEEQISSFTKHSKKLSRHDTTSLYVLQQAKPLIIEDGQKLFQLFQANENGEVSHMEIKNACDGGNAEVVKYIEKYSDTALGLLDDKTELAKLLVEIDLNHDELISEIEWKEFLIFLIEADLQFLRRKGLAGMRAYWGKGMDEEPKDCLNCVKSGFLDRGWLDDFWYYECNNNFLFAIFFSDKDHPLKKHSRFNIEFICQSYTFMIASILAMMAKNYDDERFDDTEPSGMEPGTESWFMLMMFLMATIECVMMRKFLQFVYQCPCCIMRNNRTSARRCLQGCGGMCGTSFGFVFFLFGLIFLITGIVTSVGNGSEFLVNWLISWAQSYALQLVIDGWLVFNPFRLMYCLRRCCCCLNFIGIAQWQLERQKVAEYQKLYTVPKGKEIEMNTV